MTTDLRTALHEQAASVDFRPPDLQSVKHAGNRRIRGRRFVVVFAGLAVMAVVGASTALLPPSEGRDPVGDPVPGAGVWAAGSTIYNDGAIIETGYDIRAFVRTSAGFVIGSDERTTCRAATGGLSGCDVYSVRDGTVTAIGRTLTRHLVSDGSLAGWIDLNAVGVPILRTYDQATGDFLAQHPVRGVEGGVEYLAIDGRKAYYRGGSGLFAVDLDTGAEALLHLNTAGPDYRVDSAENGLLAFQSVDESSGIFVGPSIEDARELVPGPSQADARRTAPIAPAVLSPTGQWLGVTLVTTEFGPQNQQEEVDITYLRARPHVYDVASGEEVVLALPGEPSVALAKVWLGDGTLQVVVLDGFDPSHATASPVRGSLYTCSVPTGACQFAAELGSFVVGDYTASPPVVPDGSWWTP